MNFFNQAGRMALGSRVRSFAEKISSEAAEIYNAYETDLLPKWFPVFYVLSKNGEQAASSIADEIGHSHASVSKILSEMSKVGLITEKSDPKDKRRTIIALSKYGKDVAAKIESQYQDVTAAIDQISSEAAVDLWAALDEWEKLLSRKTLLERVADARKARESSRIEIENYQPKYQKAFHDLNKEWITKYFKMEKPDIEALENPKKYILDKGGCILVATLDGKPGGVCALLPHGKKCFELAKMAVAPETRGKHVGLKLGLAAIEKARQLKADSIYLESNTVLKPAIGLYQKLGFKKVCGAKTPYERCNLQMELEL